MTKLLLATAALAAALIAPTSALAAESASVASGTLTYTSAAGQVDAVTIGNGSGAYAGQHYLSETITPTGVPGPGCTPVTGQPTVVCAGVTAFDLATLDQDDFVTVLTALPVKIDAGDGADFVTGGPGPDTVDGGAGIDDIATGGGDDRIAARDGAKDTIDCGSGDDRADADAFDVVTNCEVDPAPVVDPEQPVVEKPKGGDAEKDKPVVVDVPRAVKPGVPGLEVLPAASPVSLLAGPVQVGRDGTAPIELSCAATEVAGCTGDVFLDPAPQGKAKGHDKAKGNGKAKGKDKTKVRALAARRGRFGRSPFQIAAGKKQNLSVKLTPEARNRLGLPKAKKARAARRGRRVKAKVTVVQQGKKPVAVVIELRG